MMVPSFRVSVNEISSGSTNSSNVETGLADWWVTQELWMGSFGRVLCWVADQRLAQDSTHSPSRVRGVAVESGLGLRQDLCLDLLD